MQQTKYPDDKVEQLICEVTMVKMSDIPIINLKKSDLVFVIFFRVKMIIGLYF